MKSTQYVYTLKCKKCLSTLSKKAMKSFLISNKQIKLFSTNDYTVNIKRSTHIFMTSSCMCMVTNTICIRCNQIVGYNILSPCEICTSEKNNGHLWMFDKDIVFYDIRISGLKILRWIDNVCDEISEVEIKIR